MVKDLGKYTMECGFIYLNSLLRGSILYATETMIDIKEEDFRHIEKIEEDQMRKLFNTDQSCPIHLLYLESGQTPARFQIKRMILNFYHYILQQNEDSLLYSMLSAQIKNPIKNDFAHEVNVILKDFEIKSTATEIKNMKSSYFRKIVKERCQHTAFKYLIEKKVNGKKGRNIEYTSLKMAEYLLPEANFSLKDQRELFSIRCRTNLMPANRGIVEYCKTNCGEIMNNCHIFQCTNLNKNELEYNMDKILNGFNAEKRNHLKKWRENILKLDNITSGTSYNTVCQ
jgi:hypothetical protein